MLSNIKFTIRNSLVYSLGNLSVKLVGLVLIPIYTNPQFLSFSDYGVLGVMEATTQIIIALLGLALTQAFTRWYWDKEYSKKQKTIFFTLLSFLFGISLIFVICLIPFTEQFSQVLFKKTDFSFLIKLMLISSAIQMLSMIPLTLIKLQGKPGLYSTSNIIKLLVTLLSTIYLVVFNLKGLEGIYEAQIIGGGIFFVLLSRFIKRNINAKFELKILGDMLKFSLPLILGSISGILLITFDRYTLNYLADLPDVGVYSLGYRIANTIKILVIVSVQLALSPMLFKIMDQPDSKRVYSKIMTYFSYLVIFAVMFLSFFSLEIVKVFTTSVKYWDAAKVVPVISFALFFGMLKDTSLIGLQIIKKTKIIGTVVLLVALLNLFLNVLMIPKYTIMGAAVATLISQIIFFIVIFIYAQKHYFIPYELMKIAKMTLLALVLYGLSLLPSDLNLVLRLVIKSMLIISFPFLLFLLGFYEKIELDRMRGAWRKWHNPIKWKENLKKMNEHGLSKNRKSNN